MLHRTWVSSDPEAVDFVDHPHLLGAGPWFVPTDLETVPSGRESIFFRRELPYV